MDPDPIPVAIVQARPVVDDLAKCLERVEFLAAAAVETGARLVCFGETWLPGYPAWLDVCPDAGLWDHKPTRKVYQRLRANSVVVPGPATDRLSALAAAHSIVLVIGVHEKVEVGPGHGTLYNTLLTFDADGRLCNHHRKLVPTYTEKLVWGGGDADGLAAVATACGRVGGLVCWEHWMPLARQALHESAEQIHVAAWPTCKEMHQVASRHYAFEGRCFVLAAGSLLQAEDLPIELETPKGIRSEPSQLVLRGGSAIIAPDGRYLAGPVYDDDTILTAVLDLREIDELSLTLDTTGHYARPDLLRFTVERDTRKPATG